MENKSNSLNRIKRQQREKVLRFSIRKYSFGAASVAVAALMFLGARVASADSVVPNAPQSPQPNAGVVNPKDKVDSPEGVKVDEGNKPSENQALTESVNSVSTVDKTKLKKVVEELNALLSTKSNLDESVVSPVKDRLQKGKEALESSELAQKDIDELVELLSKDVTVVSAAKETTEAQVDKKVDNTEKPAANLASQSSPEVSASEEGQTVSAKKDALKVSVDQLQAAVLELPEHETSKEVLEKANELLGLAQGVLENTTVSLNDVEDMTKRVKRMFTSVKNATTRLNSGARDSRNGKSMARGTQFRAYAATSSSGTLKNVHYFASVDKNTNGGYNTRNDDPAFTERKTVIKSRYEQDSSGRWMVYDVYFNNNGVSMVDQSYGQHYYFQPPFNIMDPSNTVTNLTITRYENLNQDPNKKLSDGGSGFRKFGDTVTISDPWNQKDKIFSNDRRSMYDPRSGVTRPNQKWDVFKNNKDDTYLDQIVKKTDGNYTGKVSYTLGMEVGWTNASYAVHMTARVKLKNNVTDTEAANGNVYAASVTSGPTTNQSYIVGSLGTRLQNEPDAPKDPIKGQTVTKTVGDNPGDPLNPVSEGYVKHGKNGTFPPGMEWKWAGDRSPSTAQAGVFKYTSIAIYQDKTKSTDPGSGSDGTVTLNVKPKKPSITTSLKNKKGLTNQQITVNVQNGVPNGSTVKLYDGDKEIGTGTTSGTTATVTVSEALSGKPITAETVVTNTNGTVKSDKSDPVTPTEAPDTKKPTLTISPDKTVVEGETVTFTVTAKDDKSVTIDPADFLKQYGDRLVSNNNVKITPTEKVTTITIRTKKEDIGKPHTITFGAHDDAGNKAEPATFTFNVTPADKVAPTITKLTPTSNAEIDSTNPRKIIVYREEEFSVDVNLTDNSGRLDKIKVHDNAQAAAPSGNFEVTSGGRLEIPANGTSINFTDKTSNLGKAGNATDTNPYKVTISGHVGKNQVVNTPASRNIWNRYISGYDQGGLTNNDTNNGSANNANIQIEFRKQADKYTPTAVTGSKIEVATDGTISGYNTPETYIANKSDLPTKGTTPGTTTTYTWKTGETPTVNNGQVTRTVVVTYPDGSTDEVPVTFAVRDTVAPTITSLTPIKNAEIDSTNPRKIVVYREEEFSVDVNLTDNRGQLDKIKVHDNAQAAAPSGNFEVTNGGRLEIPANGTSINFTDKTSNLGKAGNATDTNPYKVNISGHVGKNQVVNTPASRNIWNRYISGYDQEGLTNNNTNNGSANNANIQIEFRKQADKYTPTAVTGSKIDVATDGTISGYNTPETYIANKSDLPTKGTTPGTTTTYTWKTGETPTVNNGQVTRTVVVTYPDGSTDEVPVTFAVRDTVAPTITNLTPIKNAEIDRTNPRKIIVYREEEFSVDVNLTDNSGRLDKIKVHDNAQAVAPSGNFEVTNGGRLDLPANGTSINFTDKTSNLGQAGNATDTNPYKVNISGHVGKDQVVNTPASRNIWNRYISGYDQEGLTNNSGNNGTANNANIQIEFRKQADKYTPTATTPTVNLTSNGTVPDLGSPETYIANKSDLPTKGTTPGTTTTYTWKDGETPTVNNGKVTRTVVVTYPDGSKDEVPVTVKVVDPRTDAAKNNPTPQDQSVNVGEKPDPKKSIGNVDDLPKGSTVEYKTPVDTATPGDKPTTVVVTYPDGSKDEVPVTVKVVDPRTDAAKNNPTPQEQSVNVGEKPDPKKSIGNVDDLPKGSTVEYKTPVDTATPGDKPTTVVVTYPDGSKDEVPVTVKVVDPRTDAEKNNPTPQDQSVNVGEKPDPKKSIGNVDDLPKGSTVEYKTPVDTATPGDKPTTVVVTYPDGSKDEVPVTVKVVDPRTDAEKNNPTPQEQSVNVGEKPDPKKSIGNVDDLPKGSTVEYKTPVDTATPGDKPTTVVVTYPDGSKDEVPVTVKVVDPRTDAEKNNPTPQEQSVNVGEKPDPKKSIGNVDDLPKGSTVEYKTPVDTTTPGDKPTTVVVTYPDGSKDEVPVTVKVVDPRTDAAKNNPTPQEQSVNVGEKPDPKKSIGNVDDLPKGSTVEYKTPVDTTTPGDKPTTVVVTYPDGSKDEVPVTVKVVDPRTDAEKNNPTPQEQSVNVGEKPDPKKSIGNVDDLPKGSTVEYKTPVDTTTPGDKPTTVVVTYPDGSKDEVPVTVKVVDPRTDAAKNNPTPQEQSVNVGEKPDPKKSIGNVDDLPKGSTVEYKTPVDTATPGDKPTTVVVTYPDGSKDEVPVTVKVVDPRTDAEKNNPTPQDQSVNVGEKPDPKKSIGNVDDLPKGSTVEYKTPVDTATPGDKPTTVVVTYPDGSKDEVPVTVKVVDPRTDAEKNNPTPQEQSVNVGEKPDPKKSIGNVDDLPKGSTVEYKTPVDTATPGDKPTTVVVTYPDGSKDEVPVTVKVVDPRTDAEKNNPTPQEQSVNVGEKPDPKKSIGNVDDLPKGSTVEYKTPVDTTTPGDKPTTVVVTYPDGSKDEVPVTVKVVDPRTDAAKNNPTPQEQSVNVGEKPDPKKSIGNVDDLPKGSTVEYKTPVDTTTPGDKPTTVVVTYPDGSKDEVPVTVKVVDPRTDAEKNNPTPQEQSVNVGEKPDPKKSIGNVDDLPKGSTVEYKTPVDTTTPGDKPTTVVVTYPDGSKDEVPVTVKVVDPRTDAEKNNPTPQEQSVNVGEKPDPKKSIGNVDDLPKGSTVEYKTPVDTTTPGDKPTTVVVTYPDGSKDEVPVTVKVVDPRTPETEKPGKIEITPQPNGDAIVTPKKPDGSTYPPGTTVEIPGENGPITVEIGKDGSGKVPNDKLPKKEVPGTGTVTEPNKKPSQPVDVTTPARKTPTVDVEQDPKTGEVTVTPKKPDGTPYKPGTKVEIPGEDGPITVEIGEDGKGKVPNDKLPKKDVPGTVKITEPGQPTVEVPDVTTPGKVTPETEKPGKIEITPQPNGDAIVTPKKPDGSTYPPGTTVEIPGENGPITVEIGKDGKGKVPNDKLPKKEVPGTGTVTEPNKKPSQPVDVTTPARKTPTVDVEQDPKTGEVTVTPKKPDGTPYKPGTKVEIPGEDGPITVEIGEDGKGKVPNDKLPKKDVPGTVKITEPGQPTVEVPDVTTPGKVTPETEQPGKIEITPQPNGDAIVTPKKPDGSTYPPGTTVEIPGENGPITVEIGKDGSGKVPNDKLPKKEVPGTGTVTEPNKKPSQPVDVTTPARKTPTVDVEQDPKTGEVTVTPKKPDGTPYKPGTKVEIPGEDGPITVEIGEDGKGKVPNDKLPKKDVPGTVKITEPGQPTVEVPDVTTPGKVTPETEQPGKIEITPQPNGDAIVTPKKPDGSTYPPGTTVEIPGENGPITVEIGKDGSGKVPNDKLPKKEVPGTGTVTEPNKKPSQPVDVTTPARKTPTVDVEQDPKTGEVTVTPKKPDGTPYKPGTKVEIPGEDGPITVEIGEDGKGKVPNDKLPKKDVPGTVKITEPGQPTVEVPDVTTPGKVTPETEQPGKIEITPQPNGDAIVTPKKPDGSTYPPGTTVEIPGENGPITVEIGKDGSGKVPNDKLPKKEVPGTGTVTEPNKKPSQPVDVTTPARKTPTVDVEQDPKTGEVTVTPKKPDGTPYKPGTKVEIPGKDGKPITVEIGEDGKGKVPNSDLPDGKVPGTAKITEPGQPAVEVPFETPAKVTPETPAQKTPTVELEQDPKTGEVTVTPKKPDGSTYPPGTTVEIPGENGPITVEIGQDGSGKVPNDKLPKKEVPGTAKITEPGQPAVEVPNVVTPGKVTPATPTDTNPGAPVTPATPTPATPTPNAVTPNADQVDTKTTMDNGAKSNDSQNVLPNTGTESNAALASLGLLGLLSGFGLVARKKKED